MRVRRSLILSPVLPFLLGAASDAVAPSTPPEIPPAIRAMLDAALASGNEDEVATIVKYARAGDPATADLVLAIAETWKADRQRRREEAVMAATPFQLWRGRAEVGGFLTTGNSNTVGATGVFDVTREGLEWRHKLKLQADYQKSLGITTRERYLFAYEPNWKVNRDSYVYGAAQFESDRFLGYTERYSLSTGAGYSAIRKTGLTLDVELGPAYRHTAFTDNTIQSALAARGSLNFGWTLTPGLTLKQAASAYVQRFNSTVSGTTALGAKLIGPLSAQVSYNFQYESDPPAGRVTTDTITRASLVYAF